MKFLGRDVTYENIKSHKKAGFHPLSIKHIFGKTTGASQIDPPLASAFKGLNLLNFHESLGCIV